MIKSIGRGGAGSEAKITVELRSQFPGIGGTIITQQAVVSALREDFNNFPDHGHRLFLKHAVLKKLDDYFQKTGKYEFTHIPRPIGSVASDAKNGSDSRGNQNGYLYEWVFGSDGFPWAACGSQIGLSEWNEFVGAFNSAGIDVSVDCTDSDNANISKNIVHQLYRYEEIIDRPQLNCLWQRIDFGDRSIIMDLDRLSKFLKAHKEGLISVLGIDRYEMIVLAMVFLKEKEKMNASDVGRLEILARHYRLSTLRHLISKNGSDILGRLPQISKNDKTNRLR